MTTARRGEWGLDTGPVPQGRWCYLSFGRDVHAFWFLALRRWSNAEQDVRDVFGVSELVDCIELYE